MHDRFMREAIALSRRGFPSPNPHVGCVIVREDKIVGRGFHDHAGGPHAEVVALTEAGDLAHGADVYVTLEPCNHHGRTPPCAQALLRARVRRVFISCVDPNPVASGGSHTLADAGVEVVTGILCAESESENWQFVESIRMNRPLIVIKAATSLDGKIAMPEGESKWITGPQAREAAHQLRAQCGSVLVGYKTVLKDNPELTARIPGVVNQPLRIVIDPDKRLTGSEKVFNPSAKTVHVTGRPVDLVALTSQLFEEGVRGILVEGGSGTISKFIAAGLADRLEIFVAPKLLGNGLTWIDGIAFPSLAETPQLSFDKIEKLGPDLRISATFLKKF